MSCACAADLKRLCNLQRACALDLRAWPPEQPLAPKTSETPEAHNGIVCIDYQVCVWRFNEWVRNHHGPYSIPHQAPCLRPPPLAVRPAGPIGSMMMRCSLHLLGLFLEPIIGQGLLTCLGSSGAALPLSSCSHTWRVGSYVLV